MICMYTYMCMYIYIHFYIYMYYLVSCRLCVKCPETSWLLGSFWFRVGARLHVDEPADLLHIFGTAGSRD